mgnify:FL=1
MTSLLDRNEFDNQVGVRALAALPETMTAPIELARAYEHASAMVMHAILPLAESLKKKDPELASELLTPNAGNWALQGAGSMIVCELLALAQANGHAGLQLPDMDALRNLTNTQVVQGAVWSRLAEQDE